MKKGLFSLFTLVSINYLAIAQTPELVKDINTEQAPQHPKLFTKVGNKLFFTLDNHLDKRQLWVANSKEIHKITDFSASFKFKSFYPLNNQLFFIDGSRYGNVWISDGSIQGTQPLFRKNDSIPREYYQVSKIQNRVFFMESNRNTKTYSFYTSDGTKEGTKELAELFPQLTKGKYYHPFQIKNNIYFFDRDEKIIWKSSKGFESLEKVDFFLGVGLDHTTKFLSFKDGVVFNTKEKWDRGKLWYSEGVGYAREELTELPFELDYHGSLKNNGGNGVTVFRSNRNSKRYPYYYDYTSNELISPFKQPRQDPISDSKGLENSILYSKHHYAKNDSVFIFSPKTMKNELIIALDGNIGEEIILFNNKLFFAYSKKISEHYSGIYNLATLDLKSNELKTYLEFSQGSKHSSPSSFTVINEKLYFMGTSGKNNKIFVSDGTTEGTMPYLDTGNFRNLKSINGQLLFEKKNGSFYSLYKSSKSNIYEYLTTIDSSSIWNEPRNWRIGDDHIFFTAVDPKQGYSLWKTDGTSKGTSIITNFKFAHWDARKDEQLIYKGDSLYFSARQNKNSVVLLGMDGTSGNSWNTTIEVADWRKVHDIMAFNNSIYFILDLPDKPSVNEICNQCEKKYKPAKWAEDHLKISNIAAADSVLYFVKTNDNNATELWKTDGTIEGNTFIKKITREVSKVTQESLVRVGNMYTSTGKIFFVIHEQKKSTLWFSDGTEENTRVLLEYSKSHETFYRRDLIGIATSGKLYFSLTTPEFGDELWISDGSIRGTTMLSDLNSGNKHSHPSEFKIIGNSLFFSANDGVHGRELWKIELFE